MHNLKGRQSAQLDTMSGLVTLAAAQDLPEGASPRLQNVDFNVGSVFTRPGLTNPFTYQDAAVSGPGNAVADVSQGSAWNNPADVLENNGAYASNLLALTEFAITAVQVLNFSGIFGTVVTFAADVPVSVAGQVYSFSGLTAYTALNGQNLAPALFPFTLAANQQMFSFGTAAYANTADTGDATVSGVVTPTDFLDITEFGFSVPSTATPQGFQIAVLGYAVGAATLHAQMLKAGVPVGNVETVALNVGAPTTVTLGGINDLVGEAWAYSDLNNTTFGVRIWVAATAPTTTYLSYTTLAAYFVPTQVNFNYVTTFEDNFGTIRTLALDANGQFWVENVSTAPGVLVPLFNGPPAGSFASSFTADSRQYIAISDLLQGNYPPQQYTGQWNDQVSQVGPGAAPNFTGITASTDSYNIASIAQPAQMSWGSIYFLRADGPGSATAGTLAIVYYADSTVTGPDTALVDAVTSGLAPVYIYCSLTGVPNPEGPYVKQVLSVGKGSPPGQPREFYYLTYDEGGVSYGLYSGSGHPGYTFTYQITAATMTMAAGPPQVAVPGLEVGNQVTITGAGVTNWDNNWTITETPNSGQFTISQTSVLDNVATYSYSLVTGVAPANGQQVTVTNTFNANGALNVVNAIIAHASGGSSGTFQVNITLPNFGAYFEPEGLATTAGTQFTFDPGAALVGSSTDPIYSDSTGGSLTFGGPTGQFIGSGTRRGTVFFITRNGYWTEPAPYVQFDITSNVVSIQATSIPIGPPNVIARAIVFTEGGANGVPGASYYTIPEPVQYVVEGVTYTASSLFVNDNTSTSATFSFPDATLLSATEVDIQGADLFNLAELPDAAWCVQYAGRSVWGRVRNQVQNFLNLSFDGGYVANPGGNLSPLGWSLNSSSGTGTLLVSPVFGNSYYMQNLTGSTQATFDMIYQSAYQDYNLVAILQNQTAYSVRVTVRTPSGATGGNLVIDLAPYDSATGFGPSVGSYTLPLASMTSTMATYEGTLLTDATLNIPANLQLRVYATSLVNNADIEIDRISIFPTQAPTNLTGLTFSYEDDPESFDQVTGGNDTATVNAQPANGAFVMHSQLYVVKESSLGYLSDSPNQEPANWNPFEEVSNVAGACGINAFDVGEEWAVMACQNGLFLFSGGAPVPIQLEIPDVWASINWAAGETICVRNDVANRKIFCAVPLPTPNPWMPDAAVNPSPSTPNVVLMLNYNGIGSIEELMSAASMQVNIMGKMVVHDMRRKWSLWTIPTPYLGMVKRNELESLMMFCNGIGSSKIYYLGSNQTGQDDGAPFTSSYCTYGFVNPTKAQESPMFGLHNKRYAYYDLLANGTGTAALTFWQNVLTAPYPYFVPGGVTLSNPAANDFEGPLDEFCQRLHLEMVMNDGWFNLSRLTLVGAADRWSPIRGF